MGATLRMRPVECGYGTGSADAGRRRCCCGCVDGIVNYIEVFTLCLVFQFIIYPIVHHVMS